MTDSLRVLHVSPYFEDAWAYGGIPRVASRLTRGLARRGHRVRVFTTDAQGSETRLEAPSETAFLGSWSQAPEDDRDGLSVTVFPNLLAGMAHRYQFFTPVGMTERSREIVSRIDIAHLHACHNLPVAQAARQLSQAGIPYILQPNGTGPRIESRRWTKWLFDQIFARGLLQEAAAILAVTEAEKRQLLSLGIPSEKIHLLPNPLDLDEIEPKPEPGEIERRWPGEARTLVYLGQLTPRKGLGTLIRAMALLPPDTRLAIFGADRGVAGGLRKLTRRLRLESRVAFLGHVEGKARFSVLAEADLVIYASRHEVFGLSAFEALLVGTPVIVGNDSGCGELVEHYGGGRTITPGNTDALAEAANAILGNPVPHARAALEAGDRLRSELGTETVCERLEGIYEKVLEHGRGRSDD